MLYGIIARSSILFLLDLFLNIMCLLNNILKADYFKKKSPFRDHDRIMSFEVYTFNCNYLKFSYFYKAINFFDM